MALFFPILSYFFLIRQKLLISAGLLTHIRYVELIFSSMTEINGLHEVFGPYFSYFFLFFLIFPNSPKAIEFCRFADS